MAEEGMDEIGRLRTRFPAWNVRRGDGLTIATRNDRCAVSEADLKAGIAFTLIADRYSATLEDQLLRQDRIESELSLRVVGWTSCGRVTSRRHSA